MLTFRNSLRCNALHPSSQGARLPPEHDDNGEISLHLVRRIQNGDAAAWDPLYRRYRDQLLLSIRFRLGTALRARLESEDILHSVFREALSDLHRFQPASPHALNRYLHACVLNKIRSKAEYYGAQKRRGEIPLTDSVVEEMQGDVPRTLSYADHERYDRLEKALERLPESMREVILLRRIEELPNEEAARVLGKSPDAVSKLYNRALARLAVTLRPRDSV